MRAAESEHGLAPGRVGDTQERSDRRHAVAGLEGGDGRLRRADRVREGSLRQAGELAHDEDEVAGSERRRRDRRWSDLRDGVDTEIGIGGPSNDLTAGVDTEIGIDRLGTFDP